jgi:predicted TPR repeat methyltransferase
MDTDLEQARRQFYAGIEAFEAGRLEEARIAFEASLALAPGRPSVLANLGITLFRQGRLDQAVPTLEQAARAEPAQADAWAYLGLSHQGLGHWPAAADALERAVGLLPGDARLWLALGRCRLALDAIAPALQAFDRAVAAAPDLAEAWSERGSLLRELHRLQEAAQCFDKALALGADAELHGYYLASVRGADAPLVSPRRYVESLFDEYADDFEQHLVDQLHYRAHESLVQPLIRGGRRFRTVLDLGCGSGLCGKLIKPLADDVDGVDVSQAMLAQARRTGVYRHLVHADLAAYLADAAIRAELVLAADVFIYVGDLTSVFASVRRVVAPGGCFAFTVELSPDGKEVQLLPSLRYAHSESYVRRLAHESGFQVREMRAAPLRNDQALPVTGLYVYLEAPS